MCVKTIKCYIDIYVNQFGIKIDHFAPNYFVQQKGLPFCLACNMTFFIYIKITSGAKGSKSTLTLLHTILGDNFDSHQYSKLIYLWMNPFAYHDLTVN